MLAASVSRLINPLHSRHTSDVDDLLNEVILVPLIVLLEPDILVTQSPQMRSREDRAGLLSREIDATLVVPDQGGFLPQRSVSLLGQTLRHTALVIRKEYP